MKTTRTFKNSWFMLSIVVAIIVAEVAAWEIASATGVRANPLVVGFLATGLVAAIVSVLYEGCDIG